MTPAAVRRPGAWALAAVPLAGVLVLAVPHPPLTRSASFRVTSPADGTAGATAIAWTAAPGASRYAVVVDAALPAPGARPEESARVLVVEGRAAQLSLGPARTGSPSVRDWHTVLVVPLDGAGRRLGEDVAVVHLKDRR